MAADDDKLETVFFEHALSVADEVTTKLNVTSNSTVQPAVLLRLGIFVPGSRSVSKGENTKIDVSNDFSKLEFAKSEGYDDISIRGDRLNITTDFSVWMGIIGAFNLYGLSSNVVRVALPEFASLCGFDSRQVNHRLRKRIFDSMHKLASKSVRFTRRTDDKTYITQLLKTSEFDPKTDMVTIQADERLWDIYQADYTILLRKHPYIMLKGKEVAQTLYTYIASLPDAAVHVSFSRIRERLLLTSSISEQNRLIKAALEHMANIGYIKYSIVKKGRESFLLIHQKNKKLKEIE
jgi:hypothetical protein